MKKENKTLTEINQVIDTASSIKKQRRSKAKMKEKECCLESNCTDCNCTDKQYIQHTNGCGPANKSWFKPPYSVFFETSCNKHDIGYTLGGDEGRRAECDYKFLAMMTKDCYKLPFMKRQWFKMWAILYTISVRLFGKSSFNYTNKK